jgi:hypothetical protein
MKEPRKIAVDPSDPEQLEMMTKFIEGFLAMPQHHQAMVNAFLEKALDGDNHATQLSEDYNAGKLSKEELWGELKRLYRQ